MATFIAMTLEVDGVKTPIWQKVEFGATVVVMGQVVSYVDAAGNSVALPETYEMAVIDGVEHSVPGVV
ncbi:hypothetical protein [Cypionkella sinensis]|uniref:Uncharacterized protein n=1 Tax=Cypionkella sinensis TaxID=1756043 RepID=A0ABV7IVB6_9RHOB